MSKLIRVDLIDRSPWAELFDHPEEHIARLTDDVRERGIQTPLHVYPRGNRFELLTGHDRLEAAKRAGLTDVPAELRQLDNEDERLRHFFRDNHLRKQPGGIERQIRFVIERHIDWTQTAIAAFIGCSVGYVNRIREEMEQERPAIFTVKITPNADGHARPTTYKPREPGPSKVVPISKVEQLRQQREAQYADAPSAAEPIQPSALTPAIVQQAVVEGLRDSRREYRESGFGKVAALVNALPIPPRIEDEEIMAAITDDAFGRGQFAKPIRAMHALLGRILELVDEKEAARVSA